MTESLSNLDIEVSHTRDIAASAIQELRQSVGWDADETAVWDDTLRTSLDVSSVWDGERLLGVGFLVGSRRHGVLCDIVVSPDVQNQGIGRGVAQSLIDSARQQGVKYITLTYDTEKPWLKDFYAELGFEGVANAMQLKD